MTCGASLSRLQRMSAWLIHRLKVTVDVLLGRTWKLFADTGYNGALTRHLKEGACKQLIPDLACESSKLQDAVSSSVF